MTEEPFDEENPPSAAASATTVPETSLEEITSRTEGTEGSDGAAPPAAPDPPPPMEALVEEGALQRMERTARLLYPTSAESARREQLLALMRTHCASVAAGLGSSLRVFH